MAHSVKATDDEVSKRLAAIEYAQGSIAHLAPDRSLADELIDDRHAGARGEQDEGSGRRC